MNNHVYTGFDQSLAVGQANEAVIEHELNRECRLATDDAAISGFASGVTTEHLLDIADLMNRASEAIIRASNKQYEA
jgi:hypothetical protein